MKTKIFNLIILDESGSMSSVCRQTISGCNETINTIKVAQEKNEASQEHYVSIFAFQSSGNRPSRYILKNQKAATVEHITEEDYKPCGGTPLYDSVGGTLADLKAVLACEEQAFGSVTIITDGYENSSRYYTQEHVMKMIEELKECGWNFNFIGANIDVKKVATGIGIENAMCFEQTSSGTTAMFEKENRCRREYYERVRRSMDSAEAAELSKRKKEQLMREAGRGFFEK